MSSSDEAGRPDGKSLDLARRRELESFRGSVQCGSRVTSSKQSTDEVAMSLRETRQQRRSTAVTVDSRYKAANSSLRVGQIVRCISQASSRL